MAVTGARRAARGRDQAEPGRRRGGRTAGPGRAPAGRLLYVGRSSGQGRPAGPVPRSNAPTAEDTAGTGSGQPTAEPPPNRRTETTNRTGPALQRADSGGHGRNGLRRRRSLRRTAGQKRPTGPVPRSNAPTAEGTAGTGSAGGGASAGPQGRNDRQDRSRAPAGRRRAGRSHARPTAELPPNIGQARPAGPGVGGPTAEHRPSRRARCSGSAGPCCRASPAGPGGAAWRARSRPGVSSAAPASRTGPRITPLPHRPPPRPCRWWESPGASSRSRPRRRRRGRGGSRGAGTRPGWRCSRRRPCRRPR